MAFTAKLELYGAELPEDFSSGSCIVVGKQTTVLDKNATHGCAARASPGRHMDFLREPLTMMSGLRTTAEWQVLTRPTEAPSALHDLLNTSQLSCKRHTSPFTAS